MTKSKPEALLWLSDAHGQHIPRLFAKSFVDRAKNVQGVSDEDWNILDAGPEHELYWDTWSDVEQSACVISNEGVRYRLYQEGDLWFIPVGMEFNEDTDTWQWPEEEQYDERI